MFVLFSVQSRSRTGTTHTVCIERARPIQISCTCEDATYRSKRGAASAQTPKCFHQKQVLELILGLMPPTATSGGFE